MTLAYRLAENVVTVRGSVEWTSDSWTKTDEADWSHVSVDVLLAVRGDEGAGAQLLDLGRHGDRDLTVELGSDLLLRSVSYKSVGVGGRVVAAGATLVASIAGLAVSAAAHAVPVPGPIALRRSFVSQESAEPAPGTEEQARSTWEAAHDELVQHARDYLELADKTAAALLAARGDLLAATQPAALAGIASRIRHLEAQLAAAAAEQAKVQALYDIWRGRQRHTHTAEHGFVLAVGELPRHGDDAGPDLSALAEPALAVWTTLGVIVEIGSAASRSGVFPGADDQQLPPGELGWRVPRPVRLWVWKRGADGTPTLITSFEASIVDGSCAVQTVRFDESSFGEHGGSIGFDAQGVATTYVRHDKSGVGAVADAVARLPAAATAGLGAATAVSGALTTLGDRAAEHQLTAARRELELAKHEVERQGLAATQADVVRLQVLQRQVALAKAGRDLA